MTRDDWQSLLAMTALAILICFTGAAMAGEPCPPKRYFCWEVKAAAKAFGEQAMRERAKACGWTDARIEAAARCLPK